MRLKIAVGSGLIALIAVFSSIAHAQTFSVIHTFTGGGEGGYPMAGVTLRGGLLFGSASVGGAKGGGTVYEIQHVGSQWVTTPIYSFGSSGNGQEPRARVVFGPDGHPYGTTALGGSSDLGIVYDLTPPLSICKTANCSWKENLLHSFTGYPTDGSIPGYGDVAFDQQGNIFGTTENGGTSKIGTVYELAHSGNGWISNVLHSFLGSPDGQSPEGGVIFDSNGNLFGTTYSGGLYGYGTVFELTFSPGSGWSEQILYNFNYDDAAGPYSGLILDSQGNLYGTSAGVGIGHGGNGGTVFELSPAGDTWTLQLLHVFSGGLVCGPHATLTRDPQGNLYGTTLCDGISKAGSVFKLTSTENGWVYTSLYDFTGGVDGANPVSSVTIDTDGTLYGTTEYGGTSRSGVVWMITP